MKKCSTIILCGLTLSMMVYSAKADAKDTTFCVVSAVVGPAKANGEAWDGTKTVDSGAIRTVLSALAAADPYTAVVSALASIQAFDKPEPYGFIELVSDDKNQGSRVSLPQNYQDTFLPAWPSGACLAVDLDGNTRLRITLVDSDLQNDDPLAVVELNKKDLKAAMRAKEVHYVDVASQSANQLLLIGISVVKD